MDHVGVVVDDLAAATEFFVELGLELLGEGSVEGRWVDRVVGLDGVRVEFAMVQTPDGNGRLEFRRTWASSRSSSPWNWRKSSVRPRRRRQMRVTPRPAQRGSEPQANLPAG